MRTDLSKLLNLIILCIYSLDFSLEFFIMIFFVTNQLNISKFLTPKYVKSYFSLIETKLHQFSKFLLIVSYNNLSIWALFTERLGSGLSTSILLPHSLLLLKLFCLWCYYVLSRYIKIDRYDIQFNSLVFLIHQYLWSKSVVQAADMQYGPKKILEYYKTVF